MVVKGLPSDIYPGYCIVSGSGSWHLRNDWDVKVDINVSSVTADGILCGR